MISLTYRLSQFAFAACKKWGQIWNMRDLCKTGFAIKLQATLGNGNTWKLSSTVQNTINSGDRMNYYAKFDVTSLWPDMVVIHYLLKMCITLNPCTKFRHRHIEKNLWASPLPRLVNTPDYTEWLTVLVIQAEVDLKSVLF